MTGNSHQAGQRGIGAAGWDFGCWLSPLPGVYSISSKPSIMDSIGMNTSNSIQPVNLWISIDSPPSEPPGWDSCTSSPQILALPDLFFKVLSEARVISVHGKKPWKADSGRTLCFGFNVFIPKMLAQGHQLCQYNLTCLPRCSSWLVEITSQLCYAHLNGQNQARLKRVTPHS